MERRLVLEIQKDQRKKHLYNRMKLIKKQFKDDWVVKVQDVKHLILYSSYVQSL
jgi:hypothetical protein